MRKSELVKIIQEEIDSVLAEQMNNDAQSVSTDPVKDINRMADALGASVSVEMRPSRNKLEFLDRDDVEEKTFERMITFLEKIGYDVDLGQSVREYEDDGDRRFYPRIIFRK